MRCMDINKQEFYYALFEGKSEIVDEYGNASGQFKLAYSKPFKHKANISAARGETETNQFGENLSYDKTIAINKGELQLDEYSILWVDTVPLLDENGFLETDSDGNTLTPHDYVVRKVGNGLNSCIIAISKVTVSG